MAIVRINNGQSGNPAMRFAKPLDTNVLDKVLAEHDHIVTLEDGCIAGGFGSAVVEYANAHGCKCRITTLGIPDRFIEHGSVDELHAECGMDEEGIEKALRSRF